MKKLAKQVGSAKKQTMGSKLSYIKKNWQLYVFFLMPALLLTIIFKYLPMGGLLIAFEDYNVIKGVLGSPWVGLEYFQRFLSSPDFMNYLLNTLKLSIFGLLWSFPIPIILALLLNRIRKAGIKKKIQLLIYAPNFISVIVLCGMVRMFLSPVGPLNRLLGTNTNWMTMPSAFRTIYIASGIWQGAGWASIMYTAALSNASKELEEAAIVDGANLLQQIWYVELPAIKDIIVIQFILQAGNIMSIGFEKAYALQTDMNLPASDFYSLAFAAISVFVTLLAAYPMSKKEFVGRKFFNVIFLITMFFGGGMIPTFILINQLHMVNTVWAILIPGAFNVWNMILARTYYQSIPKELREASAIDGANEIQHFFQIMMPVCKPIIAVLALWSFVGMWNSYFDAMIYLNDANLQPLQLVLRSILVQNTPQPGMIADIQSTAEMAKVAEQLKYATIVVSSLPLLIMYPFFQKYFDKGVMVGSVKG